MTLKNCFSDLGQPNRIWTISAIQGDVQRLEQIHTKIFESFQIGDRLVYTGNYFGHCANAQPVAVIDELLNFRRALLRPGMLSEDITYLRGVQEEMWQKLLQLQFAPCPAEILQWMVHNGIEHTLNAYGTCSEDGMRASREGILRLTKWTGALRENIRQHAGHEKFGTVLKRAAVTCDNTGKDELLFVHSGLNARQSLEKQGDSFWWNSQEFDKIDNKYNDFSYVIRGFDPAQNGVRINGVTMSLDGGCGYGGDLICAQISNQGDVLNILQA